MPAVTPAIYRGGDGKSLGDHVKLGVVTVSDRASAGVYDDLSGPAILKFFEEALKSRCCFAAVSWFHCLNKDYFSQTFTCISCMYTQASRRNCASEEVSCTGPD